MIPDKLCPASTFTISIFNTVHTHRCAMFGWGPVNEKFILSHLPMCKSEKNRFSSSHLFWLRNLKLQSSILKTLGLRTVPVCWVFFCNQYCLGNLVVREYYKRGRKFEQRSKAGGRLAPYRHTQGQQIMMPTNLKVSPFTIH